MSEYGVQKTGFVRKPLTEILKTIEISMIEVFGSGVIQTSESPLGQINGIFADAVNELWELGEDIYQSFDPDQAEGARLSSIAKLRLIGRNDLADTVLRLQIANEGVNKFNLKDVEQSLLSVGGITYLKGFLNDEGSMTSEGLALGDVAIAVIGGENSEIADQFVRLMPIGGNTYGNTLISSTVGSGVSQDFNLLRVSSVPVELSLQLSLKNETFDQFQPDTQSIVEGLVAGWLSDRINGRDVDSFTLRRIIECKYPNIQLISFTATVGGSTQSANQAVSIAFSQIASIEADDVSAVFV